MCRILRHPCLVFQSDSSVTITCANGKWNKQISCEPVDCGLPDKYHVHPAHFTFPEGTTYGKKSTFQCREPAQLVGEFRIHISADPRLRWAAGFRRRNWTNLHLPKNFCPTWLLCLSAGLYENFTQSLNQIFMKATSIALANNNNYNNNKNPLNRWICMWFIQIANHIYKYYINSSVQIQY